MIISIEIYSVMSKISQKVIVLFDTMTINIAVVYSGIITFNLVIIISDIIILNIAIILLGIAADNILIFIVSSVTIKIQGFSKIFLRHSL